VLDRVREEVLAKGKVSLDADGKWVALDRCLFRVDGSFVGQGTLFGFAADLGKDAPDTPPIMFDFDKTDIRPDQAARLNTIADWLKVHPRVLVLLEGNTDQRGTAAYQLALAR
jgi:outer membrane protein OmpA-like peptidoglycan-associated protein